MNRNQKKDWIQDLNAKIAKVESIAVANFKALTVAELESLRKSAREAGATIKVTQNRLTKIALAGTAFEPLAPLMKGPTLVAYAPDPTSAARVVHKFAKTNEKLVIIGGYSDGAILDAQGVAEVAILPTLDEARAKLLTLLKTPIGNLVRAINARGEKLAEAA
jgi:large subunit ribosomal protein L10